jgi:hypothetical protein
LLVIEVETADRNASVISTQLGVNGITDNSIHAGEWTLGLFHGEDRNKHDDLLNQTALRHAFERRKRNHTQETK